MTIRRTYPPPICTGSRLPGVEMMMARIADGPLVGRCGVCMRWIRVDQTPVGEAAGSNGVLVDH
jgi:hypothetical protein